LNAEEGGNWPDLAALVANFTLPFSRVLEEHNMSAHIAVAKVRQQLLALLATLSEDQTSVGESTRQRSPMPGPQAATPAFAAATPAGGLVLTDAQRRICIRVINVYETGSFEGDYGAISIFNDGPNDIPQVTYGRAQTTEYGNLRQLISDYVAANGRFSAQLAGYVRTIGTTVGNPPHSPLVDNQTFLTLLRNAGGDPIMRQTQDVFFDRMYFQPAVDWAAANGFVKALSALVIYDSFNHSGGILSSIRDAFPEQTPAAGGDEERWISEYVAARQNWLATNSREALHATVYRTKDLMREVNRNNWDLSMVPIVANGTPVNGAPNAAHPAVSAVATSAAPPLDDDPAAPAPSEISDTAGFELGRVLANLGAPSFPAAAPQAAAAGVSFDLARVQSFLQACETSIPRVSYGLGKKVPRLDAVPGRDFTQVDCSGFVREAIRLATTPTLALPDGSVVQHDWVSGHGFERSTVADAKIDDGIVRIAFLRPQDSAQGIGHVALISGAKTVESHGGVGPDSRVWDGASWQAKTSIYVLARSGQVALPAPAAGLVAALAAAPSFTIRHSHRYAATIVLSGFEQFAGNDQVADRFKQVGFINVVVTGSGSNRHAEGTWNGVDTTAAIDPHIRDVVEIPGPAVVASESLAGSKVEAAPPSLIAPQAIETQRPLCSNGPRIVRPLDRVVIADPPRASAILQTQSKWVNGTVLHYCFFTNGQYAIAADQANAVRQAFAKWKSVGIGLNFKEVTQLGEAEIRIGYLNGTSQSAVGRDVLNVPLNEPTTYYGWDLNTQYGSGTALHELAHVLGMEHEHQNPFAGITWNDGAVYASLGGPPNNWDRQKTYFNVLRKLDPASVQGSRWDPDSIVEYEFAAGLIVEPKQYANGLTPPGTLSAADKEWTLKWYPPMEATPTPLEPLRSTVVNLAAGQQADFAIKPSESRKYTFETKGATDALLVLFEEVDGVPRYVSGDDDSGEPRSASITCKLFAGRSYILRLRMVYPGPAGETAVIYS
jgi:hypothetical protein